MESAIAQIHLLLTHNNYRSNTERTTDTTGNNLNTERTTDTTGNNPNKYMPKSKIIATENGLINLYSNKNNH